MSFLLSKSSFIVSIPLGQVYEKMEDENTACHWQTEAHRHYPVNLNVIRYYKSTELGSFIPYFSICYFHFMRGRVRGGRDRERESNNGREGERKRESNNGREGEGERERERNNGREGEREREKGILREKEKERERNTERERERERQEY